MTVEANWWDRARLVPRWGRRGVLIESRGALESGQGFTWTWEPPRDARLRQVLGVRVTRETAPDFVVTTDSAAIPAAGLLPYAESHELEAAMGLRAALIRLPQVQLPMPIFPGRIFGMRVSNISPRAAAFRALLVVAEGRP